MSNALIIMYIFIFITVAVILIIRNRKEQENKYASTQENKNLCYSHARFDKHTYDTQKEESEMTFHRGMRNAKNNDDILRLIKKRLYERFILRQNYATTHATDKEELYRESSVMSFSIEKLKKYDDETDLIHYCALLLDAFDKDREYNYGLRDEKLYTTRYIYGSVQAIVQDEIKEIENYRTGFLAKVYAQKEKIQTQFHKQYAEEHLQMKKDER